MMVSQWKLAEEYEWKGCDRKADVEESMDIAGRYGVMNVPTLILLRMAGLWSGRWAFRAPLTSESSWIRFYKRDVPLAFKASGRSLGGSNKAERAFRPVQARKKPFCIKKYEAEDQASDDEEGDRSAQGLRRFKDGSQGHGENGNGKGVKAMAAASGRMAAAPPDEIPGPPERSTAESPDRAARATGAAREAKRQEGGDGPEEG
ncbi:MAG: hypothetical protein ACLUD2_20465 [Clostridium sp.]